MKRYDEQGIRNKAIQEQALYWYKKGLISAEKLQEVNQAFPVDFYNPTIWVKIGLFIFTCIAASFALGLSSVFFMAIFDDTLGSGILSMVYAAIFYVVLRVVINSRKMYRSGPDQALLYGAVGWAVTSILLMMSHLILEDYTLPLIAIFPVFLLAIIQFADRILTIIAVFLIFTIVQLIAFKFPIGKVILPFINLIVSAGLYGIKRKLFESDRFFYWEKCLTMLEILSLILMYASVNYALVREGNALLNSTTGQIPFAGVFYFFTATIPLAYCYAGLRYKNRILLVVGLLTLVASVVTFKLYFSIAPPEVTMIIAGVLMIGVAWRTIRYLTPPKHGFTYQEDKEALSMDAEATFIAQTLGKTTPTGQGLQFGEGEFGGGGAGNDY
ncbi:MAG: hypothetical protein U0Y10_19770 [Spirosomataceae bacterium]